MVTQEETLKSTITTILIVIGLCASAVAQRFTSPPTGWTEQPVRDGQVILDELLGGKKVITVTVNVVGTLETTANPRTLCSDNGACTPLVDYTWWMDLAYQDGNSMFVISAKCAPLWSSMGSRCDLPVLGATDGVVIERRKKNKYSVYIALRKGSMDKKGSVSRYEIVDVRLFTKTDYSK
jgi:hypothetical protein